MDAIYLVEPEEGRCSSAMVSTKATYLSSAGSGNDSKLIFFQFKRTYLSTIFEHTTPSSAEPMTAAEEQVLRRRPGRDEGISSEASTL